MKEHALRTILRKLGVQEFKRQRSGWLDFSCPLARWTHGRGTDRSMSAGALIADDGISPWKCHACKHHGRMSTLVSLHQRFSGHIVEGLLREAEMAEIDVDPVQMIEYVEFDQPPPPAREPLNEAMFDGLYPFAYDAPEAATYLQARGVSLPTATLLELFYDEEKRRVLFPVRDLRGDLWGFTGRSVDDEPRELVRGEWKSAPKVRDYYGLPKRELILGSHLWQEGRPVVIVEGLFGYAHLHEIGITDRVNVGALLGSVMTPEKAALLRQMDEAVFLLLDNDDAGDIGLFGPVLPDGQRRSEDGAVEMLRHHLPVFLPGWPEGKDDPDQLTREEVEAMLDQTPLYIP